MIPFNDNYVLNIVRRTVEAVCGGCESTLDRNLPMTMDRKGTSRLILEIACWPFQSDTLRKLNVEIYFRITGNNAVTYNYAVAG